MLPYFRWQWLWRSRMRVLAVGLVALVAGGVFVALSVLVTRPLLNRWFYVLAGGGVFLIGWGGYLLLNVLLAPEGAFRDHDYDDSREGRRRGWRKNRAPLPDDRPIPLADDDDPPTGR